MRDCTKNDAWKLADDLTVAIFGLIKAVEKETGRLGAVVAAIASAVVLCLWSCGP
jgi:hypothetical protein